MPLSGTRSKRFQKKLSRQYAGSKAAKRRFVRYSLITANLAILAGVAFFVAGGASHAAGPTSDASRLTPAAMDSNSISGPLDQLSSVDIAVNIARTTALPEAVAVTNQSDSAKVTADIAAADTAVVAKPQIVSTATKSINDLQTYVAQAGDTISSIAAKFNVTSDSIRWSNGMAGDKIKVGTQLVIPPVNGIVYTVKAGDTPDSLAQKFKADKNQIVAFNDAELSGLQVGKRIVIPNGQQAPVIAASRYSYSGSYSFTAIYGGYNGYDRGWCTWYVANKVAVPTNWGNANTWDNRARLSGWTVSSVPIKGAIAQTDRGSEGHVAYVEDVQGSMMKYSDMNGIAGFNRVGYSDWVPITKFEHYIYH